MTKLPSVTRRIKTIEAAIARMEGQLESAEGARKAALKKLIKEGESVLKMLKHPTLH